MTQPAPRDLSTADLLAYMERMQRQQNEAIDGLRQQQNEAIDGLRRQQNDTVERLERHHQAAIHELQSQMMRLKTVNSFSSQVEPRTARGENRGRTMRRVFGGRGKSLGVGVSLALLLLVAPSQSGVSLAYESVSNTAYGTGALPGDTGAYNSAFGLNALHANPTGSQNTASGGYALYFNSTGPYNTASGYGALAYNTTGGFNTASGGYALYSNTTGINNTAVGYQAGWTDTLANANTTGSNNTFIGYNSGPGTPTQLTNATAIGANAVVSQDNSIVLGGTGANTQKVGVGTTTPHSAFQIAKGFLQLRPITGSAPAAAQCATADDAGRLVVRTDGNINLYVCNGTTWIGK